MGIEPTPDYNNACPLCFDAGKTPTVMIVSFIGIEKGVLWHAGLPEPPNGLWMLPHIADCTWAKVIFDFTVNCVLSNGGFSIFLTQSPAIFAFGFVAGVSCTFAGPNSIVQPPNQHYHGGSVRASWV